MSHKKWQQSAANLFSPSSTLLVDFLKLCLPIFVDLSVYFLALHFDFKYLKSVVRPAHVQVKVKVKHDSVRILAVYSDMDEIDEIF